MCGHYFSPSPAAQLGSEGGGAAGVLDRGEGLGASVRRRCSTSENLTSGTKPGRPGWVLNTEPRTPKEIGYGFRWKLEFLPPQAPCFPTVVSFPFQDPSSGPALRKPLSFNSMGVETASIKKDTHLGAHHTPRSSPHPTLPHLSDGLIAWWG